MLHHPVDRGVFIALLYGREQLLHLVTLEEPLFLSSFLESFLSSLLFLSPTTISL
jgi:hypothetical protein